MESQQPPQQPPWEESLDLDDSDINLSLSSTTHFLRRCSRLSPPPSTPRRLIPGPAGSLQSAMHRHDILHKHHLPNTLHKNNDEDCVGEISTQEYIRRIEEDAGEEFSRDPWVYVLDSLRRGGEVDEVVCLRDVKKCGNVRRFDKVVAIVKSCSPNGLGDMMVTLKDPTDTISASIHRKVLSLGRKPITAGSVLVLQKVVAFSSSSASCYLNITRSNVVQAISVDCEVQNFREANSNLNMTQVLSKNTEIPGNTMARTSRRAEKIFEDMQQSYNVNGKAAIENLMRKENPIQAASLAYSKQSGNAANEISQEHIHINLVDSGHRAVDLSSKWRKDNSSTPSQSVSGTIEAVDRIFDEDLHYADKLRHVRDSSSGPSITENQGMSGSGAQTARLLGRIKPTLSMTDKFRDPVHAPDPASSSTPSAANVHKQGQYRVFSSAPSILQNLGYGNKSQVNCGQKRTQLTDTEATMNMAAEQDDQDTRGADGTKKQRLGLISKTSVQEWTDEQLSILDMDED